MINIKLLTNDDYLTSVWSGGKTTQFYIYPEDAIYKELNFKFRISSATVELDKSEFTKLDGVHRFITPLNKELKLTHNHKDFVELKPFDVYEFEGGIDTTSFGTARDFNLMLANGAKGKLENIFVEKNYKLGRSLNNNQFIFLFNYESKVEIVINDTRYVLNPMDSLFISVDEETNLDISINSDKKCNMLMARIDV